MIISIASLVISVFAALSFIRTGNWPILWIGLGSLVFGLGGGTSVGLYHFNIIGINSSVTTYNILSLTASSIFLISAILLRINTKKIIYFSNRVFILVLLYTGFLALGIAIIIHGVRGGFPVFFIDGIGGTPIRQAAITLAVLFFLSTGLLFLWMHSKSGLDALYWASISMFFLSLGFIALLFPIRLGSPINWLGRISLNFAGIYLFFFVFSIFGESKRKEISPTEVFDSYFREKISNYQMVFENINESIFMIDNKENIVGFNKAFLNFYKFGDPVKYPKSLKELSGYIESFELNGKKIPYREWSIRKTLEGISFLNREQILKRKDTGQKWYASYSCSALLDERDRIIGAVQIARDITTKIEAEKARLKSFQNKILTLERKKIARELHDTVSQALFSSNLFSESITKTWKADPGKALNTLETVRGLNRSALNDIRTLVFNLMPERMHIEDLAELLKELLASAEKSCPAMKTEMEINGERKLPDMVNHEIYRIAQEAINNTIKYSNASLLKVSLDSGPNGVNLAISDNGTGFDLKKRKGDRTFGIDIMKERARLIGASINIESSPERGTTISLVYSKLVDIK